MKKSTLISAVALLLGVVLWMVFRGSSANSNIGPPPLRGYDYDPPNYEPVVHPGIPEIRIAPADLTGEIAVDRSPRFAARDTLFALSGQCIIGETKVPGAFVRAELYEEGRNGRKLTHQTSQTMAKIVEGRLSYRVELRMPEDAARLRLSVAVVHFPWDFDPKSGNLPDDFITDEIANSELTVE
jgi:hypothetical protein